MKKFFTTLSLAVAMLGFNAMAADIYVDSANGNDANDGSQGAPLATFVKALQSANDGDVIIVSNTSVDAGADVARANTTLTIMGASEDRTENVITFNAPLTLRGMTLEFKNLTIAGSQTANTYMMYKDTGGVVNNVTFTNCVIRDFQYNSTGYGAIYYRGGTLTLDNCLATNNIHKDSGVFYAQDANVVLKNSQFINNTATEPGGHAGGVGFTRAGSFHAENCLMQGNTGAMYGSCFLFTKTGAGKAEFVDCTFIENIGRGCICENGGEWNMDLNRCAFINNTSNSSAPCLAFFNGVKTNITIANTTFYGNASGVENNFGGATCGQFNAVEGSTINLYYVTAVNNNTGDSPVSGSAGFNIEKYGDVTIYNCVLQNNWGPVPVPEGEEGEPYNECRDFNLSGKGTADIQCSIIGALNYPTGDNDIEPNIDENCLVNGAPSPLVDAFNPAGLSDFDAEKNCLPIANNFSVAATMGDASLVSADLLTDQLGEDRAADNKTIGAVAFVKEFVAVENVAVENVDAPAVYYNLQGQRVANPTRGLYIKQQGTKVAKVIL